MQVKAGVVWAPMVETLGQRDDAEALAIALEAGVVTVGEAIRWADREIESSAGASAEVIAVSLATKAAPAEVAHLLRSIPGELSRSQASRRALLYAKAALESGRASPTTIARSLHQMYWTGNVPCEDAGGTMAWLDEGFYLASEGIAGTVAEVEAELRDFLREHAR